jgi:MFS family permease
MGSALYGTVVGSLLGGWPADKFGRRRTLLFIGSFGYIFSLGHAAWAFSRSLQHRAGVHF